ncbi:MAG: hypothetical protein NTZ17_05885 [Phycisphaerae bacterium]|nr:hypothetical protein [Phycisphaerae bacterium]
MQCDVAIVVALKEEFRELYAHIADTCETHKDAKSQRSFYCFERRRDSHTQKYLCVATFVGRMGEKRAALVAQRLIDVYNPLTVAVVGIAGGLGDARIGDVVVGTVVDSYIEESKAVPDDSGSGFRLDLAGDPYRCSETLVNQLQHLEFAQPLVFKNWRQDCRRRLQSTIDRQVIAELIAGGLLRKQVQMLKGHVACGPTVGAAEAFTKYLKTHRDRKYLAIEMESGGILAAVADNVGSQKSLVLRGISDFGDERKEKLDAVVDGGFRQCAMHNAIGLLWSALDTGVLPSRSSEVAK